MTEKTVDPNGAILNARIDAVHVYQEMDGGDTNFALTLIQDGQQHTLPPYSVNNIDRFRIGKIDPRFVALDEDGKAYPCAGCSEGGDFARDSAGTMRRAPQPHWLGEISKWTVRLQHWHTSDRRYRWDRGQAVRHAAATGIDGSVH